MIYQCSLLELLNAKPEFIRVWKTLILKRLIDIQEEFTDIVSPIQVRLAPQTLIPAPLYDLLSTQCGRRQSRS